MICNKLNVYAKLADNDMNDNIFNRYSFAIPYTMLDGNEQIVMVERDWRLCALTRKEKTSIHFNWKFPFIAVEHLKYTDVKLNRGTDVYPVYMHIKALESPKLMAKKFGINIKDTYVDLIEDDLS